MKIIKSRIFKILVALFIIGILLGIISYIILDSTEIDKIIKNYFIIIQKGNFNYLKALIYSLFHNYKYLIIIWSSGILLFSILLIPLLIIYRGILTSFIISSIIALYGIKGILYAFILLFPCILINEIIFIFTSYYSLNITFRTINNIKNNKSINIKQYFKYYFLIFIIFLLILLLSSLFETYISSNILNFVV